LVKLATSSERANLPMGMCFDNYSSLSLKKAIIGVSVVPGATVATLIFNLPKSRAIGSVRPLIADFEELYRTCFLVPLSLRTVEKKIMTP
jgi:hypothetical protein